MGDEHAQHWDHVYGTKGTTDVSWYEARPGTSLRLVSGAAAPGAAVVDVGAGAALLADRLLELGWRDVTVLDVSSQALEVVRQRVGGDLRLSFVVADLLEWRPERQYDVWHDRAVFHFLTADDDRRRYVATAALAVRPGGALVLGTFAADGPDRCSGLPTARYDVDALVEVFGSAFVLEHSEREEHTTPAGAVQAFTWVVLRRVG